MTKGVAVREGPTGRIVAYDSAYDVEASPGRAVAITGSYCGVLPARFVAAKRPTGVVGVDCGIGKEGSGIAGLWYYEALRIPAAAADVRTVELGNGADVFESGVVSRRNAPAAALGITERMSVRDSAAVMLSNDPPVLAAAEVTNRAVVWDDGNGHAIVCTDSIAFALPEDRDRNVLCGAGHTGRSAVPYLERAMPLGFIGSDGGRGAGDSGIAGLAASERLGLAVATVDANTARMGDGHSTYYDGVISASNAIAQSRGVHPGLSARDAARLMIVKAAQ